MKRIYTIAILMLALGLFAAPALAGLYPITTSSRIYIMGNRTPSMPDPVLDRSHYPYYGYFNLFGTDTAAGSFRVFNRNASGRGLMVRLVSGTNDTTRIDSTGIYTTGSVTSGGPMVNSDSSFHRGYTSLGDSATDYIAVYGQTITRNRAGTSNWVDIKNPAALVRGSFWHSAAKLAGMGGASQWNQIFVNAQMDTAHASASIRGGEIKGTASADMSGTSQLIGLYGKTTVKSGATVAWSTPFYSLLGTETGSTTTLGHNFFAENSAQGTCVAADILGIHATNHTWTYGFDLNGGIFSTAEMRLGNGATIANGSAGKVTVTEDTIALAGVATTTSLAVGGGTVMTKIIQSGSDSLGFIVAGDTFWAFSGGVK